MRKLIINTLAFAYYIKIGKKVFDTPRIVVWALVTLSFAVMFTATDWNWANEGWETAIWWIPFGLVNILGLGYLKAKPIKFGEDFKHLSLQQKYHWLGIQVVRLNDASYELIYGRIEREFIDKYGIVNPKFAAWASMSMFIIGMAAFGFLYWKFGSPL